MSLLSEFEAKLSADVKVVWGELSSFEKVIAAKLFAGLGAAEQTVVDALPGAAAQLKSYVATLVVNAEKTYIGAGLGDLKYSVVFYQLWQTIHSGMLPLLKGITLSMMKASIEAAVLAIGV